MYTNIPMVKALSFISNHIRDTANEIQAITVEALIEALGIVMRNNVFTFGDVTYKQDRGTAMGTRPAPMWANLYMSINEDTSCNSLTLTTQPPMPPHGQHSVFN
jgi:hypothetical protein